MGLLAAAVTIALVVPRWAELAASPVPVVLAAFVIGCLPRRRWADGLVLAIPTLLADAIEQTVGPQALACIALPLYALTRRPRFAASMAAAVVGLLWISIQLKTRFAGTPLTWQDIRYFFAQFGDNVGVMATQQTLMLYAAAALLAFCALGAISWWLDRHVSSGSTRAGVVSAVLLSMVAVGWSVTRLQEAALHVRDRGAWVVGDAPLNTPSPISRFLATASLKPKWMPAAVDTSGFAAAARRWRSAPVVGQLPADIVVFLQESQFNPSSIAGCPSSLCELPTFAGGPQTRAQGPLQVPVFGGGTWLSEFAVQSGVPHTVFGRSGDFAPFNVAPGMRRSFPRSLKAAGYRTVAVYPVGGGMMNARAAYAAYGFDHFYDAADLNLPGTFDTTDAAMHEAALRVLQAERRHGQPVYLFVVTIFNHADHGIHMNRVPSTLLTAVRSHVAAPIEADNVADYLWRTGEFGLAMASTSRALLGSDRAVVLGWFGDHQPPFARATELRNRIRSFDHGDRAIPHAKQTWYHIGSNVSHLPASVERRPLDLVFLPGLLAQAAGAPLDDWLAANVLARVQCGGLLQTCSGPGIRDAYLAHLDRDLKEFELP